MKFKKVIILIIFIICIVFSTKVNAANRFMVELNADKKIVAGETVTIEVNINSNIDIQAVEMFLQYDKNIFETINSEDIEIGNIADEDGNNILNEDTVFYNEEYQDFSIETISPRASFKSGTVAKIKLKVKDNIDISNINNQQLFYISKIELTDTNFELYEDNDIIAYLETQPISSDNLYLSTDKYKIGDADSNKINEYVEGDKYLYRVSPNTKISDFLNNLSTNGTSKIIYNSDETEETNQDELIKTGMKIKVSKEGYADIVLEIIVIGDINGDGITDITDLVKLRQKIQELFEFNDIQNKAGDINEDLEADITDLVKIRQYIQELIYL